MALWLNPFTVTPNLEPALASWTCRPRSTGMVESVRLCTQSSGERRRPTARTLFQTSGKMNPSHFGNPPKIAMARSEENGLGQDDAVWSHGRVGCGIKQRAAAHRVA